MTNFLPATLFVDAVVLVVVDVVVEPIVGITVNKKIVFKNGTIHPEV